MMQAEAGGSLFLCILTVNKFKKRSGFDAYQKGNMHH